MSRTYAMRWAALPGGTHSLVIEEDGGSPAFVAEFWYEHDEQMFFADAHPAINPQFAVLDEKIADAESVEEAKSVVEDWLLEAWSLEAAHRACKERLLKIEMQ